MAFAAYCLTLCSSINISVKAVFAERSQSCTKACMVPTVTAVLALLVHKLMHGGHGVFAEQHVASTLAQAKVCVCANTQVCLGFAATRCLAHGLFAACTQSSMCRDRRNHITVKGLAPAGCNTNTFSKLGVQLMCCQLFFYNMIASPALPLLSFCFFDWLPLPVFQYITTF